MKLIRRKRKPTPAQKALDIARTGVRGLVAVRLARSAFKTYRFARRLPLLIGLGAVGAVIARKLRGGGDAQTETWSPATPGTPATTGAPSPAPELTPNPAETAGTGTPPVGGDDAGAAAPQAPADADVAAAGTADAPAGAPTTPGETPESTELDIEGPNESAPGHNPDDADRT